MATPANSGCSVVSAVWTQGDSTRATWTSSGVSTVERPNAIIRPSADSDGGPPANRPNDPLRSEICLTGPPATATWYNSGRVRVNAQK